MNTDPRSWLHSLLGAAIMLVITALLLRWAWDVVRPAVPFVIGGLVATVIFLVILRHRRNRYW